MRDPYAVLGLSRDAEDAAIRQRYLELVKQHPPDRDPQRFAAIREAFEQLKDLETRIANQLFDDYRSDTIEELVETVRKDAKRKRLSLQELLALAKLS
jgi:curved DNA-binding protein CbpA